MASEQHIIDGLFRDYGQPAFQDRDFHAYRSASREARMFLSMRLLETEIANGGLAQFLWNVFFHWRLLTDDCVFAYAAIGAEVQAAAMPEVIRLLSAHEPACEEYVVRAVARQDFAEFRAWYSIGERAMGSPVEMLFYPSDTLNALRQSWISAHGVECG